MQEILSRTHDHLLYMFDQLTISLHDLGQGMLIISQDKHSV